MGGGGQGQGGRATGPGGALRVLEGIPPVEGDQGRGAEARRLVHRLAHLEWQCSRLVRRHRRAMARLCWSREFAEEDMERPYPGRDF